MSAALLPSWAWPALSFKEIGLPLASTRAWILVVSPPRERPCIWLQGCPQRRRGSRPRGPPFDVGGVLMDADRGAVDHLQVAVVRLGNSVVNAIPDAELAPPHKAVVAGRCRPIALGNVGPWRARAQPPIDAVEDAAVVRPRHAAGLVRKQRLADGPFEIGQLITARRHCKVLPGTLHHSSPENGIPFMSSWSRVDGRFGSSITQCSLLCAKHSTGM